MSTAHSPREVRVDLGAVRLTKDKSVVQVNDNDTFYRLNSFETAFFKLAFNNTTVNDAYDCQGIPSSPRSKDIEANKSTDLKIGDIWLYVICIDPSTGAKVTLRTKVDK